MEAGLEEIRGRPPRSGFNKARSSALWRRKVVGVRRNGGSGNKGGTAYFTSLAIEILQGTFVHADRIFAECKFYMYVPQITCGKFCQEVRRNVQNEGIG